MRTSAQGLGAPSLGDTWKAQGGCSICVWHAALGKECCAVCPVTGLSLPSQRLSKI